MVVIAPRLLAIVLAACAGSVCQLPSHTDEREMALGRSMAKHFEQTHKLASDSPVTERLGRITNELAAAANLPFPAMLDVYEDSDAVALPMQAGFAFLSSDLVERATSDPVLAAIVAHVLGHFEMSHVIFRQRSLEQRSMVLIPASTCLRFSSNDFLVPNGWRNTLAEQEEGADRFATEYLRTAGYEPLTAGPELLAPRPKGEWKQPTLRRPGEAFNSTP